MSRNVFDKDMTATTGEELTSLLRDLYPTSNIMLDTDVQARLGFVEYRIKIVDTEFTSAIKKVGNAMRKHGDYTTFTWGVAAPTKLGRPAAVKDKEPVVKVDKVAVKILATLTEAEVRGSVLNIQAITDCLIGTPNVRLEKVLISMMYPEQLEAIQAAKIRTIFAVLSLLDFDCVNKYVKDGVNSAQEILCKIDSVEGQESGEPDEIVVLEDEDEYIELIDEDVEEGEDDDDKF